MHDPRTHLYRTIHRAVRLLLSELSAHVGATDFQSPLELAALRARVDRDFRMLLAHAEHEDTHVLPLLKRYCPEVAAGLSVAHHEHDRSMATLTARLAAMDATAPDALERGDSFRIALTRYVADQLSHMADEEELAMPALYEALDDARLLEVHDTLVRSVPPAEMLAWLAYMLPAISAPERVMMLAGMRAEMPPEVFQGVLEIARAALGTPAFAALAEQLERLRSRAA